LGTGDWGWETEDASSVNGSDSCGVNGLDLRLKPRPEPLSVAKRV